MNFVCKLRINTKPKNECFIRQRYNFLKQTLLLDEVSLLSNGSAQYARIHSWMNQERVLTYLDDNFLLFSLKNLARFWFLISLNWFPFTLHFARSPSIFSQTQSRKKRDKSRLNFLWNKSNVVDKTVTVLKHLSNKEWELIKKEHFLLG